MPEKKTKTEKVDAGIDKGKKVAGVVKEFTPPAVDGMIDQGEQAVEAGWGIFKMIKSLIPKKKKVRFSPFCTVHFALCINDMDPIQRQKLVNYFWLVVFAGIFCLMCYGIYRIVLAITVAVLEIS